MRQFKFDHKDIKALGILGISVGIMGTGYSKYLSKNFTLI